MSRFENGVRVRCLDNSGMASALLLVGSEYEVESVRNEGPREEIKIVGGLWWFSDRFEIVQDVTPQIDAINPPHYREHPSGVECIQVAEHMSFCIGNAVKYLWRAGKKGDAVQDLRKAVWYLEREIKRLEGGAT